LKNIEQDADNLNIDMLSSETKGFSGAELEEVVNETLFNIFDVNSSSKPILKTKDLLDVINDFYPLAKTMQERIGSLRKWSKSRTKNASKHQAEELEFKDDTPKLKQEYSENIFMEDD